MLYNSLYSFRVKLSKENVRHHLYDNLDGEDKPEKDGYAKAPTKEFTEDDLSPIDESTMNNNDDGWEYKVKSTPRKLS